ncbi:MAG TPA: hypothetical protein PLX89_04755 [Verrucomicrobiota bacterium]|nr:hypothetical protein [Verrucomicrobiota bacterium]
MADHSVEAQASVLVDALSQAWTRCREYNLNSLKKFPSAQAILKASPSVQVAVAREILARVADFAKRGKSNGVADWFTETGFPWGCVYFQSSLLKKALPFTSPELEEMFGRLADAEIVSASQFEFIGSLVGALERHVATNELTPPLRHLANHFSELLLGKNLSWADRLGWSPDAATRRAANRIQHLLARTRDSI